VVCYRANFTFNLSVRVAVHAVERFLFEDMLDIDMLDIDMFAKEIITLDKTYFAVRTRDISCGLWF
jgi:hypothetical protein